MFTQTQIEQIKSAKKKHSCDWCGERIEPGSSYFRWRFFSQSHRDEFGTCKLHPECYQDNQSMPRIELVDGWTPGQFSRPQPQSQP